MVALAVFARVVVIFFFKHFKVVELLPFVVSSCGGF